MRAGLIASLVVHGAVLVAGAVTLNFGKELPSTPVDSLPVDLVPVSELTKLRLGSKDAKEIQEVAAQKPTKKPAEKPPEPEKKAGEAKKEVPKAQEQKREAQPATPPPPAPQPEKAESAPKAPEPKVPAEAAEPAPDAKEEAKPKEIVKVRPRTKPKPPANVQRPKTQEKPKEDFNTRMAALLNKTDKTASGTSSSTTPASLGSELGQTNVTMTQSELDALRGQIARCWNPPVGAAGAENLAVVLEFNLNRSGDVEGRPRVLNTSSHPTFRAAASSAERAVFRCGPYSLPGDKYDAWKTVKINFDPREMLGF